MEFGKTPPQTLSSIDFTLPDDHPDNSRFLSGSRSDISETLFVGCAKWGRKDWIGSIYPPGTREADFLRLYAENFNSIELNASFYKTPSRKQTEAWSAQTGPGFLFCPKVPNSISHIHRLKNIDDRLRYFLDGLAGFGPHLGGVLLMLHPQMGPKSLETLDNFLQKIPDDLKIFIELRNEAWYDPSAFDEVCDMFQRNNAGAVITDVAGRRDCAHMRLTTDEAFIRFVGNDLHETDYRRVDDWVERIGHWINAGIRRVYFFLHQETEVNSPLIARYAAERFNAALGAKLVVPTLFGGNPGPA
jgi:uncharacterized protein YecE (DUF72 family)